MKTTRERRGNLIQWLESRDGPLRGYVVTYGHLQPAIEDCNELEDRLARIEQACLIRSEIDAPEWAYRWHKRAPSRNHPEGLCFWRNERGGDREAAPDLRPNLHGPVTLPIIDC